MKIIFKRIIFFYLLVLNFITIISVNKNSIDLKKLADQLKKIKIIDLNASARLGFRELRHFNNYRFTCQMLLLYNQIYNKNNPSKIIPSIQPKIPKIIHQIWLGKSHFPEKFKFITRKWLDMHPDWQYKLWTDKNIKELFPLYNQKYFDESRNFGERSDILRYEILYRFGGVYVDVDYECLTSFDMLNHSYEFFAGMEPLRLSLLNIGNSIIGSAANHPILKECIYSIKDYRNLTFIPHRTGPLHLTRSFCKVKCVDNVIIFPPTYFYPVRTYETLKKMNKTDNVYPESLGIHYWCGTWK